MRSPVPTAATTQPLDLSTIRADRGMNDCTNKSRKPSVLHGATEFIETIGGAVVGRSSETDRKRLIAANLSNCCRGEDHAGDCESEPDAEKNDSYSVSSYSYRAEALFLKDLNCE
jgi:hypothetical protein